MREKAWERKRERERERGRSKKKEKAMGDDGDDEPSERRGLWESCVFSFLGPAVLEDFGALLPRVCSSNQLCGPRRYLSVAMRQKG